jgi:nickel-dependent lactate racemase
MPQIDLAYGDHFIPLTYESGRFGVLEKSLSQPTPLTDVEIGGAFDSPIASSQLEDILQPGESVLLIVSDVTRATASAQIVNLLVRRLIQLGIAPHDIAILFATGIHRSVSDDEKRELLTPFIFQRIRTIDHNAADASQFARFGTTSQGTVAELNRALKEFDHTIITGGIGFHYFAGFTGGRKSICPGLASEKTIRNTHMLALDFDTGKRRAGVGTGLFEGNAVHEECEEIASMVHISFAVNAIVDDRGRAVKIYAGDWKEAHRVGCLEYLVDHSITTPAKRDVVVVSCGGRPYDINLIQAHKALDMAALACNEGGTIVFIAECREGLGRTDFMKWFGNGPSAEVAKRLRSEYEVNGQTAWSLLDKTERYRVFLVSSLADETVRQLNMTPSKTVPEALAEAQEAEGYIMPRGTAFLPLAPGA